MSASAAARGVRGRLWALDGWMLVAAVAATAWSTRWTGPHRASLLVLTSLFALAELGAVHITFRRDSHSFTLSDAVLVVGLCTTSPAELVVAQLVGGGIALVAHRRLPLHKLLFNLSQLALAVVAAELVWRAVLGGANVLSPRGWLAAGAAALAGEAVSVPAVLVAITLSEGSPGVRRLRTSALAVGIGIVAADIGLAGLAVWWSHPAATALLAVPVLAVHLLDRAYVAERSRNRNLQFLYNASQLIHEAPELTSAVDGLLSVVVQALRAEVAVVGRWPAHGGAVAVVRTGTEGASTSTVMPDDVVEVIEPLLGGGAVRFRGEPVGSALATVCASAPRRSGILVPLRGEAGLFGFLAVADRRTHLDRFDLGDERLLMTVGAHLAAALDNGRLEQSVEALRELERRLSHQATHDPLTGLANRDLFRTTLSQALARAATEPTRQVGVVFVDLDDFKTVNDSLGHAMGDRLLVAVAARLQRAVGTAGLAARLGGDEFAVCVDDARPGSVLDDLADRLIDALAEPVVVGGERLTPRASIGVARGAPSIDASALMRHADTAMYAAKAAGKGRWAAFAPEMQRAAVERQRLTRDLVAATDAGQMVVWMQPVIDLRSGEVRAAEALVRWQHPARGLLRPDAFIGLAEESGAIHDITRTVLDQACRSAAAWPVAPGGLVPAVTVNLSARDFEGHDLPQVVAAALARHDLAPSRLVLEITESLMLADTDDCVRQLRQLVDTGVRVALDDFGTGYSSLGYVRHLPLHWVKLAKTFTDDLHSDPTHDALAEGIISLGHLLTTEIVAEGIEREVQRATLTSFGCDMAQGYLFSRPMPAEQFAGWLGDRFAADAVASLPAAG